ncbi:MAG: DegT/DnrJ/EryC1/StrS family aminotransferase [Puniceicoccales bacterium]|jgi:dTDP-4-amino-4,6-dideoxygalactose transaminase|nr:DegT/DnrJ/EryC1/StrS family aminotransferase [Puniceicoccales bacterium]
MEIPYFRYDFLYNEFKVDVDRALQPLLDKGAFIMQDELKNFEQAIADFTGAKYAIGVGNGTDSLILMLKACGIGRGDEVIMASHTFVATATAASWLGATPVLVDCGDDHLMDVSKVEAAITPKTKAIMPTQLNGRTCEMDRLQTIADKYHLVILEDAAQALGSKYLNRCAGTWGKAGSISFYPAKVLGCFGDGGIVLTDDPAIYRTILCMRDHGRDPETNQVCMWGINSRLDNVQAAVLLAKFKHYLQTMQRRREIAQWYCDRLALIPEIILPPVPNVDTKHFDIYQNFEIEAENRDALRNFLKEHGIGTIIQWGGYALHQIKALAKDMHFNISHLSRTELLFKRCLMLPLNTSVTDDEVDYICETITRFYR